MKRAALMAGIQLALGMAAMSTAQAAIVFNGSQSSGVNLNFGSDVSFTDSNLTLRLPSDGTYGVMSVTGSYASSGTTVNMSAFFDAGGSTVANQGSNRVLINGAASGTTTLAISNNGGPGASTDGNGNHSNDAAEGISVAQVSGGSTAGAFALKGDYVTVGAYQYRLQAYEPGKSDPTQRLVAQDADGHWDYRLQNAKAATSNKPAAPVPPPSTGGGATPPNPGWRPALVPQAPSYLTHNNAVFAFGQQMIGSLHQRVGDIGGKHTADGAFEGYARVFGGDRRYSSNLTAHDYGYDYSQDLQGLQLGGQWLRAGEDNRLRVGLALSTGVARTQPGAMYGIDGKAAPLEISREKTRGQSAAITASWQNANGVYVDSAVGGSQYKSDVTTPYRAGKVARLDSNDVFASVETGYGWKVAKGVTIEPQVQVTWQKLDTDRTTDVDGVTIDLGTPELFVWRAGARAVFDADTGADGAALAQYIKLNYYDSTGPEQRASLAGTRIVTGQYGKTAEFGYGLTVSLHNGLSLYGDAAWQQGIGKVTREGWGANAGLRWAF